MEGKGWETEKRKMIKERGWNEGIAENEKEERIQLGGKMLRRLEMKKEKDVQINVQVNWNQ